MNPSYVRIRLHKDEALRRFAAWQGLAGVGPLIATADLDAVRTACDERGNWKGHAVFISDLQGWTLMNDLTGALSAVTSKDWLVLAGGDELVFAGYNDTIDYGALVLISGGVVLADILFDREAPESNICIDRRPNEHDPVTSWMDVASFIDDDELGLDADDGWLWIYKPIG